LSDYIAYLLASRRVHPKEKHNFFLHTLYFQHMKRCAKKFCIFQSKEQVCNMDSGFSLCTLL